MADTIPTTQQQFLRWQCLIRQHSVRSAGGRPSDGMRPTAVLPGAAEAVGPITVLIVKRDPEKLTEQFRHMARKTEDPSDRYDAILRFLSDAYYQQPAEFSDLISALFGVDSPLAARLTDGGACDLHFAQHNQVYRIPCTVRALAESHPHFQATYSHNLLFNPQLPGSVTVLGFEPDWQVTEVSVTND